MTQPSAFRSRPEPPGPRFGLTRALRVSVALMLAAGLVAGLGLAGWPRWQKRLSEAARDALRQALQSQKGQWQLHAVEVKGPTLLTLHGLRGAAPSGLRVQASRVQVGLDPWRAAQAAYHHRPLVTALRALEVEGLVVQVPPGPNDHPQGEPGSPLAGEDAGAHATAVEEQAERLRQAVLWLVEQADRVLPSWMTAGQALHLRLQGRWVGRPDEAGRSFWVDGRLSREQDGTLVAAARLQVEGLGHLQGQARLRSGRLDLRIAELEARGLRGQGELAAWRAGSGPLTVQGALELQAPPAAPAPGSQPAGQARVAQWPWSWARLRVDGPWGAGLPPLQVEATLARPSQHPAWQYFEGATLRATAIWKDGYLELLDGRLRRGGAQGTFSGRVRPAPPYPVAVDFTLRGLVPGRDVPWWEPYRVASLSARGHLEGPWGSWQLSADLEAPAGMLGPVSTGPAAARLLVDFAGGLLRFYDLRAPVSQGRLLASGELRWQLPGRPLEGGAQLWLEVEGRLQQATSQDAYALAAFLLGRSPSVAAKAAARAGELTGDFQLACGWWPAPSGLAGRIVSLRFDGPDASVAVEAADGGHRVLAERVNLAGPLWEPWLRDVSGFAQLEGRLADGRLEGLLTVEELSWRGLALGRLVAPLVVADGRLEVRELALRGGQVEGQAAVRWDWASTSAVVARGRLRWASAELPAAVAEGELSWQQGLLALRDGRILLNGRPVAVAEGTLPSDPREAAGQGLRLKVQELPVELLPWVLAGRIQEGRLSGSLELTGSLARPVLQGSLLLSAASVEFAGFPGRLEQVEARLEAEGSTLRLRKAQARTPGGGPVVAVGSAQLASVWPLRLSPVELSLRLDQARLAGNVGPSVELDGRFSGSLELAGEWSPELRPQLRGAVTVQSGRLVLWRQGLTGRVLSALARALGMAGEASAGPAPPASAPLGPPIGLDVAVRVEPAARLEIPPVGGSGWLTGTVRLVGDLHQPALDGELVVERARLRYLGRELRLERSRLTFTPSRGLWPGLDLTARLEGPAGSVAVWAWGRPDEAGGLQLASRPELPPEELARQLVPLAELAPGQPAGSVAAAGALREALQQAVREELVRWVTAPVREPLRDLLGLDELDLLPPQGGEGWRLQLSRYLEQARVYVRYRRSLQPADGAQELELQLPLSEQLSLDVGVREAVGLRAGLTWQLQF